MEQHSENSDGVEVRENTIARAERGFCFADGDFVRTFSLQYTVYAEKGKDGDW